MLIESLEFDWCSFQEESIFIQYIYIYVSLLYIYMYQFDGAPIEGKIRDHRNEPWNVANFHSEFQFQVTFQSQVSPCHFPPRLVSNVLPQATSSPGDPLSSLPKFTFKASKNPGTQPRPSSCHTTRKGTQWWPGPSRSPKSHPACRRKPVAIIWSQILNDLNDCASFFVRKSLLPKLWELMTKKPSKHFHDFCSSLYPFRFSLQNAWELQNQIFLKQ